MARKFTQIAFTPAVKVAQEQRGSRQTYARFEQNGPSNDTITPEIEEFIAQMDGFIWELSVLMVIPTFNFVVDNLGF
ncbi:hypothetical protein [Nostoc sp. 'Peltigera malacea cyanobiont' DB3992]|uniref:hypothetical protein n=1 Tax=Nostoc sp. 'Peltigera malacea cyanobiont' DB3992 TaxID=1206980 RepID=UPI00211DA62C|nr:hypothetical protein [Nostoc sp. 'Peltigera malacea cyanobiont' DB3992]